MSFTPFPLFGVAYWGCIMIQLKCQCCGFESEFDDNEAAFIKGLILAFLTAIPTPLPALLYVPSGIVGFVHNLRRK